MLVSRHLSSNRSRLASGRARGIEIFRTGAVEVITADQKNRLQFLMSRTRTYLVIGAVLLVELVWVRFIFYLVLGS